MHRTPGTDLCVPDEGAIQVIRDMPKGEWFTIGEVPIEEPYKALIYLLVKQPKHKGYILKATDHYVRFMWQKNSPKKE